MCQKISDLHIGSIYCSRLQGDLISLMKSFSCGNEYIDTFLTQKAATSIDNTTHVVWDDEADIAIAAFSLACTSLNLLYGKNEVCESIPAVEITYFAVDKRYQRTLLTENREDGYVSDLVMDRAMSLIYSVTDQYFAATYVTLYATPDSIHFYERNGFHIDEARYWRRRSYALDGCFFMQKEL